MLHLVSWECNKLINIEGGYKFLLFYFADATNNKKDIGRNAPVALAGNISNEKYLMNLTNSLEASIIHQTS